VILLPCVPVLSYDQGHAAWIAFSFGICSRSINLSLSDGFALRGVFFFGLIWGCLPPLGQTPILCADLRDLISFPFCWVVSISYLPAIVCVTMPAIIISGQGQCRLSF
jgi:hypothetical protein